MHMAVNPASREQAEEAELEGRGRKEEEGK
jgi:hypothetical protein